MGSFVTILGTLGLLLIASLVLAFVLLPLVLAAIAKLRRSNFHFTSSQSLLYAGTVWHTRFLPKKHSFSYPIFMFSIDLDAEYQHNKSSSSSSSCFNDQLWPLSWIMSFRESDHLKNGEALIIEEDQDKNDDTNNALQERIFRLVETKTRGTFTPTRDTHRVLLLTHLCYYGYNFNPVSFYYILDRSSSKVSAMVGEVSNTPWLEMYPYVLHPDSVDQVQVKTSDNDKKNKLNYVFAKNFHVSPFMEMDYLYDWTFQGCPALLQEKDGDDDSFNNSNNNNNNNTMTVINTMRRDTTIHFTAKLVVEPVSLHNPISIVWQYMIRYPVFCGIIQVWIHWQALLLFWKGVSFIPHPGGEETAASKAIAFVMAPFLAMKAKTSSISKEKETTTTIDPNATSKKER